MLSPDTPEELFTLAQAGSFFTSVYDFSGRCLFLSDSWWWYTGMNRDSQVGLGWTLCIHPDDRPAFLEQWRDAVGLGHPFDIDMRIRAKEGDYRWHKHTVERRAHAVDGRGERWLGISTDVTRLKEQLFAADERNRLKDEFFALAAHELRNPLMPIRHSLRVFERSAHPAIVATLRRQVTQLTRVIEDLADVARVSSVHKLALSHSWVDARDLLLHALEPAHALIEDKRVSS